MNYNPEFLSLINVCIEQKQYLGLGNPEAKILFVGKEPGCPIGSPVTHGSGESWKENIIDYSNQFVPEDLNIKNNKHTWQKYQKLYETILVELGFVEKTKKEKYEITFVKNVFTTELSNLAAPKTIEAKKLKDFSSNLENRKGIFWRSEFLRQFPIVIVMASDNKYIETYKGEVCKLFDVEFVEQFLCSKSQKIWIHYSNKGKNSVFPKMVIHTRQLTNGASDELINKIAKIVKEFVVSHGINIIVK